VIRKKGLEKKKSFNVGKLNRGNVNWGGEGVGCRKAVGEARRRPKKDNLEKGGGESRFKKSLDGICCCGKSSPKM